MVGPRRDRERDHQQRAGNTGGAANVAALNTSSLTGNNTTGDQAATGTAAEGGAAPVTGAGIWGRAVGRGCGWIAVSDM